MYERKRTAELGYIQTRSEYISERVWIRTEQGRTFSCPAAKWQLTKQKEV